MYLLDVMVVVFVFDEDGEWILFFVVVWGYYVEIGGMILGFMFVFLIEV